MAITEKYASSAGAGANDGSSEANAWSWATMLTSAAAGDRINFKGNHTLTANATFTSAGTATSPIILRGYNSTIGDLATAGRTNGNGPLITTNFPVLSASGAYGLTLPTFGAIETMAIAIDRNGILLQLGTSSVAVRCSVNNSSTGASATAITSGTYAVVVDCDALLSGGSGGLAALNTAASPIDVIGTRIDGAAAVGLRAGSGQVRAYACTIIGGTDAVLSNTANNSHLLVNCTIVGGSSTGVYQITGPTRLMAVVNCLITDHATYGLYSVDAGAGILAVGNRYDRNGTANTNGATDWLSAFSSYNNTSSATQSNEFPGYGSDDFRLGSTSPARGIGIPAYLDVGALQRIEDYPAVGNVQNDDTTDGATGTLTLPAIADVESGVQYGAGGTEFTGTLTAGSGAGAWAHRMIGGGF